MLAPDSRKWWVGAVVGVAASLLVALEGNGQSPRKGARTPTRWSPAEENESKAEKDSNVVEGLADDDSPRSKPGDKAKTQKKKKVTSKSTQSAETMPQGRRRPPSIVTEQSPVATIGGGGLSAET
jgi:hypothetical protein